MRSTPSLHPGDCPEGWTFFQLLFGCPTANLLRHYWGDSLTHPTLTIAFYSNRRSPGTSWRGWIPNSGWAHSRDWTGNFLILVATPYLTKPHASKSAISQLLKTKTKSYGLYELGTTLEFTSWIFPSLNIQFP